jgi:hypothetical protein
MKVLLKSFHHLENKTSIGKNATTYPSLKLQKR